MRILGRLKNFRNFLKAVFAILRWGYPARKLLVIGVTGTDGKTTTAHLIYEILKKASYRVGLVSTIGAFIGDKKLDTGLHTTMPEPFQIQKILSGMASRGITHAVLEVTSHGMDQHRALGCNFKVGVLTNITHEHTDYHRSFENYRKVKARLFRGVDVAVLNKDDANFIYVRQHTNPTAKVITYPEASDYNLSNIHAASAAAKALGIKQNIIKKAIEEFPGVQGRMEVIDEGQDFTVVVDFAHTPAALENALKALRKKTKGKLIAVFGSAGERDRTKRALMAQLSGRLADYTILTAEDPRSENIHDILNQMEKGIKKTRGKYKKIPERGEAIAFAIQKLAKKGDVVGIFGKGHEKSMAYNGTEYPWSDQEAARLALKGGVKKLRR